MAEESGGGKKKYELAAAYIKILPTVSGLTDQLKNSFKRAMPQSRMLTEQLGRGVFSAGKNLQTVLGTASKLVKPFNATLGAGMRLSAETFSKTLQFGAKAAGATLATSIGAVAAQTVGGGLSRSLAINAAESKLHALGYQGERFNSIMQSASESVDGTAYGLDDSVGAAANLLASGIEVGDGLTGVLKNIAKMKDMAGDTRTYKEISSMMSKNAASGVVQMEDMNQLLDAGIPITAALARNLGKSVQEIKKMSSAGEITFDVLNSTISEIEFDSALYAAENVMLALGNVRAQLSKIGANLWDPIIDGLGPILGDVRSMLVSFKNTFNFTPIQTKIASQMEKIAGVFEKLKDADGNFDNSKMVVWLDKMTAKWEKFKVTIKGLEGPIVGAMIGIGAGMLAGIPLIGPMFAGLTPLVGLFAGTLIAAYRNSEKLRDTIKGLGKWFLDLGTKILSVFSKEDGSSPEFIGKFGDNLATGIGKFTSVVDAVVDKLLEHKDKIAAAFKSVIDTLKNVIPKGKDGAAVDMTSFGQSIGNGIISFIELMAGYINTLIPIVASVTIAVGTILSSQWLKGLVSMIGDIAGAIAGSKTLTMIAGITIGALLLGKLFGGPLMKMLGWITMLGGKTKGKHRKDTGLGVMLSSFVGGLATGMFSIVKATPKILGGLAAITIILGAVAGMGALLGIDAVQESFGNIGTAFKSMFGFMKDLILSVAGFVTENKGLSAVLGVVAVVLFASLRVILTAAASFMASLLPLVPQILMGALAITIILAAIAGIGWLAGLNGVMDAFRNFGNLLEEVTSWITQILTDVWNAIKPILDWLAGTFLAVLAIVASTVATVITAIVQNLDDILISAGTFVTALAGSFVTFLTTLAIWGPAAGLGAMSAAAGIAALFLAMGAGSMIASAGNAVSGFIDGLSGSESPIQTVISALNALRDAGNIVADMPSTWQSVLDGAFLFGQGIPSKIAEGIQSNASIMSIESELASMLSQGQSYLDSNPLRITANMDAPNLSAGGRYVGAGGGGGVVNNSSKTFNISTRNNDAATAFERAARGL